MINNIAILGWGSLLWDANVEFDARHNSWQSEGPRLPIEFSRISISRRGALTLVVDPINGVNTKVAYSFSTRKKLEDAIEDLRVRESTTRKNIGTLVASETVSAESSISEAVRQWASQNNVAAVVWTNLVSNFAEKTGRSFTVANAISYLSELEDEERQVALDYIRNAPEFVQTPLRVAVASYFT